MVSFYLSIYLSFYLSIHPQLMLVTNCFGVFREDVSASHHLLLLSDAETFCPGPTFIWAWWKKGKKNCRLNSIKAVKLASLARIDAFRRSLDGLWRLTSCSYRSKKATFVLFFWGFFKRSEEKVWNLSAAATAETFKTSNFSQAIKIRRKKKKNHRRGEISAV